MRAGWGERLRDAVRRGDSAAGPIAEVVAVADSDVRTTRAQWEAATRTNVQSITDGGVRLQSSSTTRITHTTATDPTDIVRLTNGSPFDGILIEWFGEGARFRELRNFVARLHPRVDGGQPKEVAFWVCEMYRVSRIADDEIDAQLIQSRQVEAVGDVATDVTFNFAGFRGTYPLVGDPPQGSVLSRPMTVVRIVAIEADGTIAGNVSWQGSSTNGDSQSGGLYEVTHYTFNDLPPATGVTSWFFQGDRSDLPRFTLNESTYSDGDVEFDGANDFNDLSGAGDTVVVVRGTQPSDSEIRGFIWDGSAYVRCYDGDIVGQDNRVTIGGETFGGDLSGVSTTGPWDLRVYLDASTDFLNTPTVRDFGLERIERTLLTGAARITGGAQKISDLTSLKGNIAAADIEIAKSGEKDYDDYGSRILATNHIGDIEVRVWIGDLTGNELARSEWMLHSAWEIETYHNLSSSHKMRVVSPLRRVRKLIPPFVEDPLDPPNGKREAITLSDDIFAVWSEIIDAQLGLPARYIGPGPSDETTVIGTTIKKADAKDTLDAISYLDGGTNIESQGRIKHVRIMHDDPADEAPVFTLPLGTYEPLSIGPGFDARTDEFFVKYNFNELTQEFEDERRHVNLAALGNLGTGGLNTTQELRDEVAQWINTEALADAVGRRVPKHFGTGELVWHVRPMERMPEIEIGDVGVIETDMFVARTPVNGRELRGLLGTRCVVVGVDDVEGRGLWLWVPSYELIEPLAAATTRNGFVTPQVADLEVAYNGDGDAFARVLTTSAASVRVLDSTSAFPDPSAETAVATDADGWAEVALSTGYAVGADTYISVIAYELVAGGGAASARSVAKVTRPDPGEIIASQMSAQAQRFATDIVFSATDNDTVAWASGSVTLADGTTYSITAGNTGTMAALTFIYLDTAVSTTVLQTTTTFGTSVGDTKILLCAARQATAGTQNAFFVPAVGVFGVNEEQISANAISADKIQANAITAGKISVASLSAISADLGTVTAGYIQNSGNTAAIRLSGTTTLPSTNFVDFTATGSDPFLKHDALELRANGDAIFGGVLEAGGIRFGPLHMATTDRAISTLGATLETITVPAGVMGTQGGVRLTAHLNVTGTNALKTVAIYFGGVAVLSNQFATSFTGRVFLEMLLANTGTASSQRASATFVITAGDSEVLIGSGTIDTTAAADLEIRATRGSGSDDVTLETSIAELIAPGA